MPPRKTRAKTTAAAAESPAKVVDTEEEVAEVEVAESKKASTRAKRGRSASATSAADAADAADAVDKEEDSAVVAASTEDSEDDDATQKKAKIEEVEGNAAAEVEGGSDTWKDVSSPVPDASVAVEENAKVAAEVVNNGNEKEHGHGDDEHGNPIVVSYSSDRNTCTVNIPENKCGQMIGAKGAVIQTLQSRSGSKIQLVQDVPAGEPRTMTIIGTHEQVAEAFKMVKAILKDGPQAVHENSMTGGPKVSETLKCNKSLVGRVIGQGGQNIKEIQSRSGARVQVDQDVPEGEPSNVVITGTVKAVEEAKQLVAYVMEFGPQMPPLASNVPTPQFNGPLELGPGQNRIAGGVSMDCDTQHVGRVIGRKGEVIKIIQAVTSARVQLDQNQPTGMPCLINIVGPDNVIQHAISIIANVMLNGAQDLIRQHGNNDGRGQQMNNGQQGYQGQNQQGYQGQNHQQQNMGYGQQMGQNNYGQQQGQGNHYQQQQQPQFNQQQQQHYQQPQQHQQQPYQQQQQPMGMQAQQFAPPQMASNLPQGWTEHADPASGNKYYHNIALGQTTWDKPN